jgi:hypothetical protein
MALDESRKNIKSTRRRLELAKFFQNDAHEDNSVKRFHVPSSWNPPKDPNCFEFEFNLLRDTHPNLIHPRPDICHSNLPKLALKAIPRLLNNNDFVVVLTDKNLGFALVPKTELHLQTRNWVTNKTKDGLDYYSESALSPNQAMKAMRNKLIPCLQPSLSRIRNKPRFDHQAYFLPHVTNFGQTDCSLPYLHLLPKVHKTPMQWRPIIGAHSTPLSPASRLIAAALQDWQLKIRQALPNDIRYGGIPSPILRDTVDFVATLPLTINNPNITLHSADVSGMYNELRHSEIIDNLIWINTNVLEFQPFNVSDKWDLTFDVLLKTLRVIITNNYFLACDKVYLQVIGIAMGTNCAVDAANLTMLAYELRAVATNILPPFPSTNLNGKEIPDFFYFRRYLDDIFIIARTDPNYTDRFTSIYPKHLTVKWESSKEKVPFLDVLVSMIPQQSYTDIITGRYAKFDRSVQFPHRRSNHPRSTFGTVIKNEYSRLRLLHSEDDAYLRDCQVFRSFLLNKRGYPANELRSIPPPHSERRTDLNRIQDSRMFKNPPIVWVFQYDDVLDHEFHPRKLLYTTWNHEVSDLPRPIVAFKKSPNLFNMLVRSNACHSTTSSHIATTPVAMSPGDRDT